MPGYCQVSTTIDSAETPAPPMITSGSRKGPVTPAVG
jgi:hypothetical protein